ncbi:hypothetical protein JHK87_013927 [Glycine soja]|nr:hypothetical protein JHK87_013927 [Glycine soja]
MVPKQTRPSLSLSLFFLLSNQHIRSDILVEINVSRLNEITFSFLCPLTSSSDGERTAIESLTTNATQEVKQYATGLIECRSWNIWLFSCKMIGDEFLEQLTLIIEYYVDLLGYASIFWKRKTCLQEGRAMGLETGSLHSSSRDSRWDSPVKELGGVISNMLRSGLVLE